MKGKQTTKTLKETDGNQTFKVNTEAVKSMLKKAENSKVMFVILIGSYQTGKSSKIARLIDSKDVVIGDGMLETTHGAYIYGPVSLNDLKERFDCFPDDNDDTVIFFIDTEGANGFNTGNSPEETTYLISQFIAPYAALSNVIITINKPNITVDEVESTLKMLDIFQRIRSSGNGKKANVINIINDVYSAKDNYKSKKDAILETFQGRSKELYHDVTLFPIFDTTNPWYEQSKFYNKGFEYFAKELIQKLDKSKNEAFIDYQEALDVFTNLIDITRDQNIDKLAKQARENAKQTAFERLYKPKIENMIQESINKVKEGCEEYLKDDNILSISKYEPNSIIEEFNGKLNEEIPLIAQNDEFFSKIKKEGKDIISKQIANCQNLIFSKIQTNIIAKSKTELNKILSQYEDKISKYEGNNLNEILPTEEDIKSKLTQSIGEMLQNSGLSKDFLTDINNEMNKSIHDGYEELQIIGYRKFYRSFINKLIQELETKCKSETIEIKENDGHIIF